MRRIVSVVILLAGVVLVRSVSCCARAARDLRGLERSADPRGSVDAQRVWRRAPGQPVRIPATGVFWKAAPARAGPWWRIDRAGAAGR